MNGQAGVGTLSPNSCPELCVLITLLVPCTLLPLSCSVPWEDALCGALAPGSCPLAPIWICTGKPWQGSGKWQGERGQEILLALFCLVPGLAVPLGAPASEGQPPSISLALNPELGP